MVLVGRGGFAAVQPEGIGGTDAVDRIRGIGIAGQQRAGQAVHRRRARGGDEPRLTLGIGCVGIGGEVVIERHVLLKDHHQVLDRGCGPPVVGIFARERGP